MGMNVGYYILCLILMLPLAGVTAFGLLIESLTKLGVWATLGIVFSPLYDPLGDGIWTIFGILGVLAVLAPGFFQRTRAAGFIILAIAAAACVGFIFYAFPAERDGGVLIILSPSIAGVALSIYCAVRTLRPAPQPVYRAQAFPPPAIPGKV